VLRQISSARLAAVWIVFLLTFTCQANELPLISRLVDQTTSPCTPLTIHFSVFDPDTSAENLIVSAFSDTPEWLGSTDLVLSHFGTNWALTIDPPPGPFGTALVTISANDGQAISTNSLHFTVAHCNRPPFIFPIPDQNTNEDSSLVLQLAASFCDPCVSLSPSSIFWLATSDNPTLFPTSSISILRNGTNATLILRPSQHQTGDSTITILAGDDTGS
jgi:hypothetical protein